MSDDLNIAVNLFVLILVADSWRQHYIVKDGIARVMFLWGCGFLAVYLAVRLTLFTMLKFSLIDTDTLVNLMQHAVWLIYALIIGQQVIQRKL